MLWINIEKQRKCPQFLKLCLADGYADATYLRLVLKSKGNTRHFVFYIIFRVRMGELREARIPMRPAIGVLLRPTGYMFTVLAWLYMALLKQLLTQFEFFTFLRKQAFCAHRLSTLAQSDDKQPSRRQGEHEKALVKMHTKWKLLWMLKNTYANVIRIQ